MSAVRIVEHASLLLRADGFISPNSSERGLVLVVYILHNSNGSNTKPLLTWSQESDLTPDMSREDVQIGTGIESQAESTANVQPQEMLPLIPRRSLHPMSIV